MNNIDDDDHRETRPLLRTLDAGMLEIREEGGRGGQTGILNACRGKMMLKTLWGVFGDAAAGRARWLKAG